MNRALPLPRGGEGGGGKGGTRNGGPAHFIAGEQDRVVTHSGNAIDAAR